MAKVTVTSSTSKPSNAGNSSSNSFGSPNLGVPSFNPVTLNSSSEMGRANFFGEQGGFGQLSQAQSAASFGAGLAAQTYQNRANTDFNQAARLNDLNRGNSSFSAGNTTTTGDPIALRTARNSSQSAERIAALQGYQQGQLSNQEYLQNQDIRRRELSNQKELTLLQGDVQRDVAGMNAQAQVLSSGMNAFGGVLSSLFGSVNSGAPNYKYW